MKYFLIILLLVFSFESVSQNEPTFEKYVGFEIYLLKDFEFNKKSYLHLNEKQKLEFRKTFKNKKMRDIPDSLCYNYINLDRITLEDQAFLTKSDIKYYIRDSCTIVLSESGIEKMKDFHPEIYGSPFVIVANGKKILSSWFRPSYSSQIVDKISVTTNHTIPSMNYKPQEELILDFLDGLGCGTDLRNAPTFINELTLIEN